MPFLSQEGHRQPYVLRPNHEGRLREVELLWQTVRGMDIHLQTKKRMLNHAIWLVVELTGNFFLPLQERGRPEHYPRPYPEGPCLSKKAFG
jgi:hypothetical protein